LSRGSVLWLGVHQNIICVKFAHTITSHAVQVNTCDLIMSYDIEVKVYDETYTSTVLNGDPVRC
jgi:hypothetical protein